MMQAFQQITYSDICLCIQSRTGLKIRVCCTVHMCLYTPVSSYCRNKMFLQSPFRNTPYLLSLLKHHSPFEQPIRACVVILIAVQSAVVHVFLMGESARIVALPGLDWVDGSYVIQCRPPLQEFEVGCKRVEVLVFPSPITLV